jgi:hypothetical protein
VQRQLPARSAIGFGSGPGLGNDVGGNAGEIGFVVDDSDQALVASSTLSSISPTV